MEVTYLVYILLIGLVVGFIADQLMKGRGYGLVGNTIVGVIGALIGGFVFGLLPISAGGGLVGALVTAVGSSIVL